MKVLFYLFLTFILIYFTFIFFWYLYPARIFGIKYNVVSSLKLNDFNKGPYLFVVDHTEPSNTDIMIMSEELHNCLEPEKFNLIAKDCKNTIDKYSLYYTKYNIIKVKNKTVNKSIEKIKNNENVLIFFNKRMESNGIYYILKETKVPLVFVHKNLIKKNDSKFKYEILKYRGMEYDIKYNIIKDYDTNKTPEEFMSWIKEKLFSSQI